MDPTLTNKVTIILPASTNYLTKIHHHEMANAIIAFGLLRAHNNLNGKPL